MAASLSTKGVFRRRLILGAGAALTAAACGRVSAQDEELKMMGGEAGYADSEWRAMTENEWRERLSPVAFAVLRQEATERPFTSSLNDEKREGVFACAGCDLPLFHSSTKYDSGTGWPSFYDAMDGALGTKIDRRLFTPRIEYHCARCLGHQGHVFNDGPEPTGLRYCNNGAALTFKPA